MMRIFNTKLAQFESQPPLEPQPPPEQFYFKGDLCEYTGKSEMLYGKMAYEFRYLEGHKMDTIGVTYNPPTAQ